MEHEKILTDILTRVAGEQNYKNCEIQFKSISSGGANYTSKLYLATISSPEKNDLRLFVKLAAIGEKLRAATPFQLFTVESCFYRKLCKVYEGLEEKHLTLPEHRLVTPKFYAANNECYKEALVLEDLTVAGYQAYNRFEPITWEYAKSSVKILTKLHALSIAWSLDDPEAFKEFGDLLETELNDFTLGEYSQNVAKNALEIIKESNKERVQKYLQDMMGDQKFRNYHEPVRCPVIAFGDYRPSNLMHKKNKDGTFDIISVDYQTLRIGNPISDLVYLVFNGSDKAFRKTYFKKTIELYYSELCAALKRLNVDPDSVYKREDFDYELDKVLPFGLLLSMFCLLIVTVNEEDAPKVDQNIEMMDFAITPNQLYIERLNDIIDDFIEMEII